MNSIQKIESLPEQIWQEGMQFLGDFWIIKVLEGLPNLLRGFREGFTLKIA